MNDTKKVMVLGAGVGQVKLINLYHHYSCYVIVVSPAGKYPGFDICDEAFYADVRDKEIILQKAIESHIVAIATDQLDQSVPTAAYVAEKMNLRGITYNTSLKFTNKYLMRKSAYNIGVNVPNCFTASNIDEFKEKFSASNLHYPLIMKPIDGSASNGIHLVKSFADVKRFFVSSIQYSQSASLIFEQYIYGHEYVIEAYTHNYETTNLCVGEREYFDKEDCFIPKSTLFCNAQNVVDETLVKLLIIHKKLVSGFGLNFGMTHGEYLIEDGTGDIYLVEVAARGGGVFTSSDIVPAVCGIDVEKLLVKDTLGLLKAPFPINSKNYLAGYVCFLLPKGTITDIRWKKNLCLINGVINYNISNFNIGDIVGDIIDKSSRKGPFVISVQSKNDFDTVIQELKDSLQIDVLTDNGIQGAEW